MSIAEECAAAALKVAESPEWWYFGRNNSYPAYNTIAMKSFADVGQFAPASNVFEVLKLDLGKLSEIYDTNPPATSCEELGFCRAGSEESWAKLAVLAGKTINWVLCHGSPEGKLVRIYRPDGSVERPE
jgi:hypothetical protein